MNHGQTTGNQNPSQGEHETYEIEMKSKPRRALGGKGLLSHENSVQGLHKSMAKILTPREEKGGGREAPGRRRLISSCARGKEKREREERVGGGVFNPLTLD